MFEQALSIINFYFYRTDRMAYKFFIRLLNIYIIFIMQVILLHGRIAGNKAIFLLYKMYIS